MLSGITVETRYIFLKIQTGISSLGRVSDSFYVSLSQMKDDVQIIVTLQHFYPGIHYKRRFGCKQCKHNMKKMLYLVFHGITKLTLSLQWN